MANIDRLAVVWMASVGGGECMVDGFAKVKDVRIYWEKLANVLPLSMLPTDILLQAPVVLQIQIG
jgi:hypothetical protein